MKNLHAFVVYSITFMPIICLLISFGFGNILVTTLEGLMKNLDSKVETWRVENRKKLLSILAYTLNLELLHTSLLYQVLYAVLII